MYCTMARGGAILPYYGVSSDCKAEGIDRYGDAERCVDTEAVRFTTLHG